MTYRVYLPDSKRHIGRLLGTYYGCEDKTDALDKHAVAAGFADFSAACEETGDNVDTFNVEWAEDLDTARGE